jgi:phosphoribosylamine--glycine ligase
MLTRAGPKVLEFNSRFGDPETQVYLPLLETDLFEALWASAEGDLPPDALRWNNLACVCVVLASEGYPAAYPKGRPILGLDRVARLPQTKVFHAGTAAENGRLVTAGGRVLGVSAWAATLPEARERAYAGVDLLHFDGVHFRHDIGAQAIKTSYS